MYSGSIHYIEMPLHIKEDDSQWKICNIFCQDSNGSQPSLQWIARPESIVMMAMKNPHSNIAQDLNRNTFTGNQVLNIIVKCKNNDYSLIGQQIHSIR